jgi:hypothetical protein
MAQIYKGYKLKHRNQKNDRLPDGWYVYSNRRNKKNMVRISRGMAYKEAKAYVDKLVAFLEVHKDANVLKGE